jgi:hypothetical protein
VAYCDNAHSTQREFDVGEPSLRLPTFAPLIC